MEAEARGGDRQEELLQKDCHGGLDFVPDRDRSVEVNIDVPAPLEARVGCVVPALDRVLGLLDGQAFEGDPQP